MALSTFTSRLSMTLDVINNRESSDCATLSTRENNSNIDSRNIRRFWNMHAPKAPIEISAPSLFP